MSELLLQLSLMGLEAALAAGVLLALFSARRVVGLAPVYTTVGVFYYLATLLASTTFVKVTPQLLLSPGSVALFPASLFAVLLVYIREDAKEARTMIYGLLAANVSASLLGLLVSQHLQGPLAVNPLALTADLFVQSPRLFIVGTVTLFADTILIILAYEAMSRFLPSLFLRVSISLALVLTFDTLLFVTGSFVENPAYVSILFSDIVGKLAAVVIYALTLTLYLSYAVGAKVAHDGRFALGDLFHVLTYRQKYEALRDQVIRDSLTGIHNRGYFDEMLRAQLAVARANDTPLALMMIDVDHFKRINDTHGHSEGDRALRIVARTLASAVRATDVVCRYGGEEFCIILPGAALDSAARLARRMCDEVPVACMREGIGAGVRVTVTIGVAICPNDGAEPEALIRAADKRLYRGKGLGRDRVVAN